MSKILHPFQNLLNRADLTQVERVALYGLMVLSTHEQYEKLNPEELWDKLLSEYEETKHFAAMEGVPQDNSNEIDPNTVEREQKIDNLLMMRPVSKLKN